MSLLLVPDSDSYTDVSVIVLDLVRVVTAYFPHSATLAQAGMPFTQKLFEASGWKWEPWPTPFPKHLETNILLSLRALANLFQTSGSPAITTNIGTWVKGVCVTSFKGGTSDLTCASLHQLFEELLKPSLVPLVKSQWVALATIALKYVAMHQRS